MKLWDKGLETDGKVEQFTVGNDRELDLFLAPYDIQATRAHANMLGKVGLLNEQEVEATNRALDEIEEERQKGDFTIEEEFEDVHSKIEFLLTKKLGDTGKKIHTARSRNDQVLVALQLYVKDEIKEVGELCRNLFELLIRQAENYQNVLMPGYTHMQIAMPSSFGLWFSAYAESLIDDLLLMETAFRVADQNPLGSAAGYGSSFPIDRDATTTSLGFSTMKYNSVAAQMGRGKVEQLTACGLAAVAGTLSRLAMDVCLYMGQNFDFISFPDNLTTGSSIMPHKKNPDLFELIRAKCNKVKGVPALISAITTNLPSGYHRDMQVLKDIIINAFQEMKSSLDMAVMSLEKIQVKEEILKDAKYNYIFSVERLNQLVVQGVPFRDAYKQVGKEIQDGSFTPPEELSHTHKGSLGNLCLEEIRAKLKLIKSF